MADETYTTQNYAERGGDKWVVDGELEILPGAKVNGLPGAFTAAENHQNSTATTSDWYAEVYEPVYTAKQSTGA